jgi:hypothetical protein
MKSLHAESLLHVPLVDFVLHQKEAQIVARPIDLGWYHYDLLPISTVGFAPFSGSLFCARNSCFGRWHSNSAGSARPFNTDEWLMYEVFFLVHDYFHLWAIGELIDELLPTRQGTIILDDETVSNLEFIYVVSEAAATVGLDYWYLARIDLNQLCSIGTRFRGLTSSYREADLDRYRRFNEQFQVQHPSFFQWMLNGYCTGTFRGFSADDLRSDDNLMHWLGHEVRMSQKQVAYIREWLCYLAGRHEPSAAVTAAPVDLGQGCRRRLVEGIVEKLWRISRGDEYPILRPYQLSFQSPNQRKGFDIDYRFTNIHALDGWPNFSAEHFDSLSREQFIYLVSQFLSSYKFEKEDIALRPHVDSLFNSRDFKGFQRLVEGRELIKGEGRCSESIAFPN